MFEGGTVTYSAELLGLLLPEIVIPMTPPVADVLVRCDGSAADITMRLGPFESEQEGRLAAEVAMRRVWGALLVEVPHAFTSAKPPGTPLVRFRRRQTDPNVLHLEAAVVASATCDATITMTPGPRDLQRVSATAIAPSWTPDESVVFERYERALAETDPVSQFLALYEVATYAVEVQLGEEDEVGQQRFDAEIRKLDPTIPDLPPERKANPNETPFTRARNRLLHPHGRRVSWPDARSYAAGQVQPFRELVARLVARAAMMSP